MNKLNNWSMVVITYSIAVVLSVVTLALDSLYLFSIINLGIFVGYLFAAATVFPRVYVQRLTTKVGAVLFFLTCGITHFHLAVHAGLGDALTVEDYLSWHMVVNHTIQVVSVWAFLGGLYRELSVGTVIPLGVEHERDQPS